MSWPLLPLSIIANIYVTRLCEINIYQILAPRPMATNNRIPFVVTYHPGLPNIGSILRELHLFLHYSERCKQAIRDVPMMALRRPKSLQDFVRAKLRPLIKLLEGTEELINVRVIDAMSVIMLL